MVRSDTAVGTPDYISPEVSSQKFITDLPRALTVNCCIFYSIIMLSLSACITFGKMKVVITTVISLGHAIVFKVAGSS